MCYGLPEIAIKTNRQAKDKDKDKKNSSPKMSYQRITLREYFRMCQGTRPNDTLRQIKEESRASSYSSIAETPNFNQLEKQKGVRGKIKTDTCQVDTENQLRLNTLNCGQSKGNAYSLQKKPKVESILLKKQFNKKKVFSKNHYNSIRQHSEMTNRRTLNSFYQIEKNKKKMLRKVQQEKDRANNLMLSDIFVVTKYGSRFKLDAKNIKNE